MATKADLRAEMASIRAEMAAFQAELKGDVASLESRLTWRIIGIVGFFATSPTLLNRFPG